MLKIEKKIKDSQNILYLINEIISENFFGQKKVVEEVLSCILSSSNSLLVGVPGLGKTLLFEILSKKLSLSSMRVQCTPDLMPSDIIGTEILSSRTKNNFSFIKGPIFCNLLMVDEINRASPRTQSALLQAMQEGFVTVSGKNFQLPKPFFVLATQNPIEQEGTYNLPEAQLDRFMMQINISYPDHETEKRILINAKNQVNTGKNLNSNHLLELMNIIDDLPIGEKVLNFALKLIRNLRPETTNFDFVKKYINWGPGPRGGQALIKAAKSRCFIKGNLTPSMSDIISIAQPVLRHRISQNFEGRSEQLRNDIIIKKVCEEID